MWAVLKTARHKKKWTQIDQFELRMHFEHSNTVAYKSVKVGKQSEIQSNIQNIPQKVLKSFCYQLSLETALSCSGVFMFHSFWFHISLRISAGWDRILWFQGGKKYGEHFYIQQILM